MYQKMNLLLVDFHSEFLVIVDKEGRVRSGYSNFVCNTCQATSKKYTLTCPSTGEKNTMKGNALGSYDGTKDFVIKDMIKDIKTLMAEYHEDVKLFDMKIKYSFNYFIYNSIYNNRSQCTMRSVKSCRNNPETGDTKGMGLNSGISYLMAIPYIAATIFAILFFLQKKKTIPHY